MWIAWSSSKRKPEGCAHAAKSLLEKDSWLKFSKLLERISCWLQSCKSSLPCTRIKERLHTNINIYLALWSTYIFPLNWNLRLRTLFLVMTWSAVCTTIKDWGQKALSITHCTTDTCKMPQSPKLIWWTELFSIIQLLMSKKNYFSVAINHLEYAAKGNSTEF